MSVTAGLPSSLTLIVMTADRLEIGMRSCSGRDFEVCNSLFPSMSPTRLTFFAEGCVWKSVFFTTGRVEETFVTVVIFGFYWVEAVPL